jgi:hypothetical protein
MTLRLSSVIACSTPSTSACLQLVNPLTFAIQLAI